MSRNARQEVKSEQESSRQATQARSAKDQTTIPLPPGNMDNAAYSQSGTQRDSEQVS